MSVDEEADPGGLGEHDSEGLLPEAVAGAVQIGLAELAKLDAVVAEAEVETAAYVTKPQMVAQNLRRKVFGVSGSGKWA